MLLKRNQSYQINYIQILVMYLLMLKILKQNHGNQIQLNYQLFTIYIIIQFQDYLNISRSLF